MSLDHTPTNKPIYRPGPEPSKKAPDYTGGADQSNRRLLVTYRDQHRSTRFAEGRPWWGHIEIPADPLMPPGMVAAPIPGSSETPFGTRFDPTEGQWEAPWYPDVKYFDYDHRKQTIRIRYDKMLVDYKEANKKWLAAANKVAAGNGWEPPMLTGKPHPRYIDIIGPLPQSVKIPEAAIAGDPWLLGFSSEPNDKLADALRETTYGDWEGMDYESALLIAQGKQVTTAPLSTPDAVLGMSHEDVQALVAQAVAAALAAHGVASTPKKRKGPGPDHMQHMREKAAAKRAAQAEHASP